MKLKTKSLIKIAVAVIATWLFIHYWGHTANIIKALFAAAFPLIVGTLLAYPLNILMSFYERHLFTKTRKALLIKGRRALALVLALLTLVSVIALVIALVLPQLIDCIKLLIAEVPTALSMITAKLSEFDFVPENIIETLKGIDWQSKISDIIKTVTSGLGSVMDVVVSTVSSVVSGVTTTFLAIIFSIYVLLYKDKLGSQLKTLMARYLPKKISDKIYYVSSVADNAFHRFIVAQCTEALILGLLCTLGMFILRLPYAAMIGAVTAVTAFIPIVGALLGGGIGAFLILMESPVKALIFLVFIIVLQQLEGDLIYPRVVGTSMGLPSIWVLAAVTVGGSMFGILGMMFSVPVAATIYRLIRNDVYKDTSEKTEEIPVPVTCEAEQSNP
ncbi:MAG: AI-2E family transporter [Oscillospiraceae bacterium]|nr:AI-2E family transporter [Oscillospiraceae bacterium]MDD6145744.1 AI-2E family transporter [Oscillospiraceae bacterium]